MPRAANFPGGHGCDSIASFFEADVDLSVCWLCTTSPITSQLLVSACWNSHDHGVEALLLAPDSQLSVGLLWFTDQIGREAPALSSELCLPVSLSRISASLVHTALQLLASTASTAHQILFLSSPDPLWWCFVCLWSFCFYMAHSGSDKCKQWFLAQAWAIVWILLLSSRALNMQRVKMKGSAFQTMELKRLYSFLQ